jgi:NAD(P)-dependent dehydrogenase (short-subunit alcohol dehydrogenase family)
MGSSDSVTVVTGSTRGIGEGVAKRFAADGSSVVVTGRTVEDGERVVDEIESGGGTATFVEADVRDPADIEALVDAAVERFGRIDVLVNNAGAATDTTARDATLDDWAFVIETDFRSYWLCAKHAVEQMPAGGSIVNVSSNQAFQTIPGQFPYNAVKAGINGMTRAMAVELGPEIRVNTINPGWVVVPRVEELLSPDEWRHLQSIHPVGRIGTPEDIAGVAAFLASEDAAFVTGATILADGGRAPVMQDDLVPDYGSESESGSGTGTASDRGRERDGA